MKTSKNHSTWSDFQSDFQNHILLSIIMFFFLETLSSVSCIFPTFHKTSRGSSWRKKNCHLWIHISLTDEILNYSYLPVCLSSPVPCPPLTHMQASITNSFSRLFWRSEKKMPRMLACISFSLFSISASATELGFLRPQHMVNYKLKRQKEWVRVGKWLKYQCCCWKPAQCSKGKAAANKLTLEGDRKIEAHIVWQSAHDGDLESLIKGYIMHRRGQVNHSGKMSTENTIKISGSGSHLCRINNLTLLTCHTVKPSLVKIKTCVCC